VVLVIAALRGRGLLARRPAGADEALQLAHRITRPLGDVVWVGHQRPVALEILLALQTGRESVGDGQLEVEIDLAEPPIGDGGWHGDVAGEEVRLLVAQRRVQLAIADVARDDTRKNRMDE